MLIVPTIISYSIMMAESATVVEDLEDGEIESEDEQLAEGNYEEKNEEPVLTVDVDEKPQDKPNTQEYYYSKSGKKKKSKSNKGEQKFKDKSKKNRKYVTPTEDDFAGNIEKAIRKAMNKNDEGECNVENDVDERRKHKKRKKYEGKEGPNKKRKKQDYGEEMDESEMMCVRGASPVQKQSPVDVYQDDERDSYASDSSHDSRGVQQHRPQRHRQTQRDRNKNNKNDRRRTHPNQDPDGVCLYFMQGKCHKGDDCIYSHDAHPPRKLELCKFYLMDCCAKREKCLYLHADFPCKYYHTGLPCIFKDECKFAHGKPLSDNFKNILLKHIESAPKEILGDFPRLNREGAMNMIQTTQVKLMQQFSETTDAQDKGIPSLFELNIPNPQGMSDSLQMNQFGNERQNKVSSKVRQSRWQNENSNQNYNASLSPGGSSGTSGTTNVLSIRNLTGVLTPRQISDLTKMGIDNLDQLGQLTVLQLNSIGLSLKQITEIQLNTMSIQKLGLINSNTESQTHQFASTASTQDLDLRVPPVVPASHNISSDLPGKDIDMRFQPPVTVPAPEEASSNKIIYKDTQLPRDTIDIDQYTKDALKFATKDKENIDISNESFENEKPVISHESKDVDHRVLPFTDDGPRILHTPIPDSNAKKECDTDIRFLQPDPLFKNTEKRNRRSTTDDDEDNNLLIDEKWYSSDEEKGNKKKSPASSPLQKSLSPQISAPHVIEPATVLSRLGDLSKIDISEEVTKLLNTMKSNLPQNKSDNNSEESDSQSTRDPRSRRSPDKISDTNKVIIKKPRVSIYECVDGEPTDGRRRTDVDLRQTDYNIPTFGDTDLRQGSSGDIDFRLGLPFKPIPNYTPASEINGSINSHPPINYKLIPLVIPRPDYTDIRNSTAKSQALLDPRLRKVFRLSLDESNSDSEKSTKTTPSGPRVDPRRKPKETIDISSQDQKSNSLELQTILQNSNWYRDLSSTQKIFVNQHLAPLTQSIKQYQQDKTIGKKFDLISVQNNNVLCNIFTHLGISLGENGEFSYIPKPKEALLKTPINFNQNTNPFGLNPNMGVPSNMDSNNINMMNIPPMGMGSMNNMNLGNMHGYNQSLPDPRGGPAPGLLGIAPNMPHNFNNNNFGAPNNFGNMPFNGQAPGNDFNFMEGEQNYTRFPNRGGHRGRGNERWNRGGAGRGGQRDRKNFNDRGNWKNDRI